MKKMHYSGHVHYRLYKPEDFAALYAIEEVCFQSPHRFSRTHMRELIHQPCAATWIAEEEQRMCGFGVVEWTGETAGAVAYIQTLEVLPGSRGQCVGGELLRCMENSARDARVEAIWLHVDAENAEAIRVYERHGYELKGRRPGYYGRGSVAHIYAKRIGAEGS
jgi:ribosomal protein S18 acetylase RimI-like enzyme